MELKFGDSCAPYEHLHLCIEKTRTSEAPGLCTCIVDSSLYEDKINWFLLIRFGFVRINYV